MEKRYTLQLETAMVNQVLAALQELPYRVSAAPIGVIMKQVQDQDAATKVVGDNAIIKPVKE